ncbi:MAG: HlyD family efflux transporter periplasmic adaptor subunit [Cellulosilyticaceae bacterium]
MSINKQKRTNTYQLEDYRNKKEGRRTSYDNPYSNGASDEGRRTSQNPYRNHYQSNGPIDTERRQATGYQQPFFYDQQEAKASATPEARRQAIKQNNKITRKDALKHRKRQRKLFIRRLIAVGSVVAFSAYGIIKCVDLIRYPSISYQVVQEGVIDNGQMREGMIVRNEQVVMGKKEGNIHYIIGEGEKVAKNGQVCFVADDDQIASTLDAMTALDEDIYSLQDKRSEYSYFQSEIHALNREIKEDMGNFYSNKYWQKPGEVYGLRKQLERVIQNRTDIYMNDQSELTEAMQVSRKELQEKLKNDKYVGYAEQAGVISYTIDGYEGLNFENVQQLQEKDYKKALKEAKNLDVMTTDYSGVDRPMYKVVNDNQWKIVTYMDFEEAQQYTVGHNYVFHFEAYGERPVNFKLESAVEENGEMKCVFTGKDYISDFLNTRYVKFVIGKNKAEGLKIPLKAIVEKNIMPIPNEYIVEEGRQKGVLRQNGAEVQFTPINVQYVNDTHSSILQQIDNPQTVQLGQSIKHPTEDASYTLSAVDVVKGVYVINGSYAKFKPVSILMANEDYAVLEKGNRASVKERDQIISNPQKIKEDQLLKYMDVKNE